MVGQVLVNSVCTYNDPVLKIWYKFEVSNPKLNSTSVSFGVLNVNSGTDVYPVTSVSSLVISTVVKEGVRSLPANNAYSTLSQSQLGTTGTFTMSISILFAVIKTLRVSSLDTPSFDAPVVTGLGEGDRQEILIRQVFNRCVIVWDRQGVLS